MAIKNVFSIGNKSKIIFYNISVCDIVVMFCKKNIWRNKMKKIVMTGGGSMLKGLPKLISKETNVPVILVEKPLDVAFLADAFVFRETLRSRHGH